MTLADRVCELARSCVGIREATGRNDGPRVEVWNGGRKDPDGVGEPYCAHWVAWLHRQVGQPIPGDVVPTPAHANPLASAAFLERVYRDHGWVHAEGQPGDVLFLVGNTPSGRHVGVVISEGADGYHTVEANVANGVLCMFHPRGNPRITGFGRMPDLERPCPSP